MVVSNKFTHLKEAHSISYVFCIFCRRKSFCVYRYSRILFDA